MPKSTLMERLCRLFQLTSQDYANMSVRYFAHFEGTRIHFCNPIFSPDMRHVSQFFADEV